MVGRGRTVHAGGGADVRPPAEAVLHGDEVEKGCHLQAGVRHRLHRGVPRRARLPGERLPTKPLISHSTAEKFNSPPVKPFISFNNNTLSFYILPLHTGVLSAPLPLLAQEDP